MNTWTKKKFILGLVIAVFPVVANGGKDDPIGDFFKRLGQSIANAGRTQPARRTAQKSTTKRKSAKDSNALQDQSQLTPAQSEATVQSDANSPTPAPVLPSVRRALAAPAAKGQKRDVPYGIPVPGKQGFVTSPFAPDGGLVDVRGFPPGTEVKDPYTGKIFLTP